MVLPDVTLLCGLSVLVVVASACHSLTGFGFSLAVTPIASRLWEPKGAVILGTALSMVIGIPLLVDTYRHIRWVDVGLLLAASVAGAPLGALVLHAMNPNILKLTLGIVVFVFSVMSIIGMQRFTISPKKSFAVAAGAFGGFLQTSTSMSGPPIVIYFIAVADARARETGPEHGPQMVRGSLVAFFVPVCALALIANAIAGDVRPNHAALCAILLPPVAIGYWAGRRLRTKVSPARFGKIMLWFLAFTGVVAILTATSGLHG
jgi:uncharacterized membrane protein YfcA